MQPIIYLRVSTDRQDEQNQLADCLSLCKELSLGAPETISEHGESAFKADHPPLLKSLLVRAAKGQVKDIIVWDYDRLARKRRRFVEMIREYGKLGVKFHSVRQRWLEGINKIPEPWNEIFSEQMLQIVGFMAEDESAKRSDRAKASIAERRKKGERIGRQCLMSRTERERITGEILRLRGEGLSIGNIAKQVQYRTTRNLMRRASAGFIHKTIAQNHREGAA